MVAYAGGMGSASEPARVRTVGAREFKDHCLQILREVNETGESVVVMRHKVPIAQVSAPPLMTPESLFGRCAAELKIHGDITGSAFNPEEFDMEDRPERVLDPEGYDLDSSV